MIVRILQKGWLTKKILYTANDAMLVKVCVLLVRIYYGNNLCAGICRGGTNKSNSTAGAVQVEANLQKQLDYHYFTLTKTKMLLKRQVVNVISHVCACLHIFRNITI